MMSRQMFEQISLKAVERFRREKLHLEMEVCTTELGNNCKVYKVFGISTERNLVKIALPDMVMEEVSISTLYNPSDAEDMFWESVEGEQQ